MSGGRVEDEGVEGGRSDGRGEDGGSGGGGGGGGGGEERWSSGG